MFSDIKFIMFQICQVINKCYEITIKLQNTDLYFQFLNTCNKA